MSKVQEENVIGKTRPYRRLGRPPSPLMAGEKLAIASSTTICTRERF
ncbi:hypothetical protein [Coleofasciculus sp. F4-SAH-05]